MKDEKICRVCQTTSKIKDYTKIYGDDVKIAKDIYEISAVQIIELSNTDPAMICSDCLLNLKISINFKKSCKQSDDQFRKCFKKEELKRWEENYEALKKGDQNQVAHIDIKQEISQLEVVAVKCEPPVCYDDDDDYNWQDDDNGAFDNNWWDNHHEDSVQEPQDTPGKAKRRTRGQGAFECDECLYKFAFKKNLERHKRNQHNSESKVNIICFKCDASFENFKRYETHVSLYHGKGTFYCDLCGHVFKSFSKLRHHMRNKLGRKRPTVVLVDCFHCDKTFKSVYEYDRHLNTTHGEGSFFCDCCGKYFNHIQKLRKHFYDMKWLRSEKGAKYTQSLKVKYKRESKTGPSSKTAFICATCGRSCQSLHYLNIHELSHKEKSEIELFKCEICGSEARSKGTLKTHMKTQHMNIRFHCSYQGCQQIYRTKYRLNDHIKTVHEKIFDLNCQFCGKAFANKPKLERHTRIHTGDAKYECKYCGQRFIQNTDCRRHEWKHTGFKGNIQCPNCEERFIKKSDLQNHLNRCQRY